MPRWTYTGWEDLESGEDLESREELLKMLLEGRRTWEREATEKAKEREEQTCHTIEDEQQVCVMQA